MQWWKKGANWEQNRKREPCNTHLDLGCVGPGSNVCLQYPPLTHTPSSTQTRCAWSTERGYGVYDRTRRTTVRRSRRQCLTAGLCFASIGVTARFDGWFGLSGILHGHFNPLTSSRPAHTHTRTHAHMHTCKTLRIPTVGTAGDPGFTRWSRLAIMYVCLGSGRNYSSEEEEDKERGEQVRWSKPRIKFRPGEEEDGVSPAIPLGWMDGAFCMVERADGWMDGRTYGGREGIQT